jgi:alpha-mannosidase
MAAKLTVHMIANAHIDPVWMWTWPAGVDEAINTCRAACDLLDEYPELTITRGEAWVYEQVRTLCPDLFQRIRQFVKAGRWEAVTGWWVQADTNMAAAETLIKQGEIGREWFRHHLGVDVTIGYEVDSFGHPATLPALLRAAGIDKLVWGRPERPTSPLPAKLFTWRAPDGQSVTAAHIPVSYCARSIEDLVQHIEGGIEAAYPGLGHTLAFYGVGDHGGGPSRQQIEWIRQHGRYRDGVELAFSTLGCFFEAVKASGLTLPVFEGELQWVSPGCYAAVHETKQMLRQTETLLTQAQEMVRRYPDLAPADAASRLHEGWTHVCFNTFHDILPGSSIEPAYPHVRDDLGAARRNARQILTHITRRRTFDLNPCPQQRVILHNVTGQPFAGVVETEPYLGHISYAIPVRYTTTDGREVPLQKTAGNAAEQKMFRYLVSVAVPAFSRQVFEVHHDRPCEARPTRPATAPDSNSVENEFLAVRTGSAGIASIRRKDGNVEMLGTGGVRIAAFVDNSDSWGHLVPDAIFGTEPAGEFAVESWKVIETGPLRAAISGDLRLRHSRILWRVFLHAGDPAVHMRLRVCYQGGHEIVKLIVPPAFRPTVRIDGVPGGRIARPMNRQEFPFQGHVTVHDDAASLSLVTRDAYALDVQPDGAIRLSLLRSPNFCHNHNFREPIPDEHVYPLMSQGEHVYDISLLPAARYASEPIDAAVHRLSEPVWMSENTVGMPPRHYTNLKERLPSGSQGDTWTN